MKRIVVAVAFAGVSLGGCTQEAVVDPLMTEGFRQQRAFDTWAAESFQDAAIRAGVLEQHALFPYHFAPGTATLTELGQRDLAILADGYKTAPGPITLVKADTPDDLYGRRRDAITAALQEAGVTGVTVADGPVGGAGITGQEAVVARRQKQAYGTAANTDTGSITDTGSVAPMGEPR
jgi:hypothetical protein